MKFYLNVSIDNASNVRAKRLGGCLQLCGLPPIVVREVTEDVRVAGLNPPPAVWQALTKETGGSKEHALERAVDGSWQRRLGG